MTPAATSATARVFPDTSQDSGIVITRLAGGLGNQLFQYAAGRRLALVNGFRLKLDTSGLDRKLSLDTRRSIKLGHFQIEPELASPEELSRLRRGRLALWVGRFVGRRQQSHIRERHHHFDPSILEIRSEVYLSGYWQSEKYFADVSEVIRSEVVVKTTPTGENSSLLQQIDEGESISVHVRRGDYVTNPKAKRLHGNCCPLEYYRAGIAEITRRTKAPHFFVFSDDIPWARQHLAFNGPVTFVGHNGPDQDYEDLRLMSHCQHHIIANSSFSWWGAWLAAHRDQIVIAPRSWFASGALQTQDVCPPSWLRM